MTRIGVEYETQRVNNNFPKILMDKVREYAKSRGIPITYALQDLINKGLEYDKLIESTFMIGQMYKDFSEGKLENPDKI